MNRKKSLEYAFYDLCLLIAILIFLSIIRNPR